MNVNIKNLNLSVIMPAITKSSQPVCNDRVPSKEDKVERTSGLYLIYEDGHAEPFTGDNSKDCVRYIGLKHGYMSFAISLTEHDSVQLLDDDSREESGSGTYYERECDALFDIDGRGNTERLVARNPKLRNLLEDGEYIPSLGQLNLMAHYKDSINDALEYIGAEPLASSAWFWSSTEGSQNYAYQVGSSRSLKANGNMKAVIGGRKRNFTDMPENDPMYRANTNRKYEYTDKANKRSVWEVSTSAFHDAHFAVFPPALIVDCIKAGCPEDGIVLDPFMGSGTTAIVSRKLNRNYVGFELNKDYVQLAKNRIKKELGIFQ